MTESFLGMLTQIRAIADVRDNPGAYGLRTPSSEPIKISRQVEVKPGEAWGEFRPFQIYLEGIGAYLDTLNLGEISTIQSDLSTMKSKLNELIAQYNQLLDDHNTSTIPSFANSVTPIP